MNKTDIFNSLLIDSIFENEIITNNVDTCLIIDELLTDDSVKLKCGLFNVHIVEKYKMEYFLI